MSWRTTSVRAPSERPNAMPSPDRSETCPTCGLLAPGADAILCVCDLAILRTSLAARSKELRDADTDRQWLRGGNRQLIAERDALRAEVERLRGIHDLAVRKRKIERLLDTTTGNCLDCRATDIGPCAHHMPIFDEMQRTQDDLDRAIDTALAAPKETQS